MKLFRSGKSDKIPERRLTPPYGTAAVVKKEESPSLLQAALEAAAAAEQLVAEAHAEIAKMASVAALAAGPEKNLGLARADLEKARRLIEAGDYPAAGALAQNAFNFARLAVNEAIGWLGKIRTVSETRLAVEHRHFDLLHTIAEARHIGDAVRLATNASPWRTLRLLDLAAEMRLREVEALLQAVNGRFGKGEVEALETDLERAAIWLEQAAGYAQVLAAFDKYLAAPVTEIAAKERCVRDLARAIFALWNDNLTDALRQSLNRAETMHRNAFNSSSATEHQQAVEAFVAAINLMEAHLQQEAIDRVQNGRLSLTGKPPSFFASPAYRELIRVDNVNELAARFAPARTPKERISQSPLRHGSESRIGQ